MPEAQTSFAETARQRHTLNRSFKKRLYRMVVQPADYSKPVIVKHGASVVPFQIEPEFCLVDLILNENAGTLFGFSPFNVRAIRDDGHVIGFLDSLYPGETIILETAVNIKEALSGPKFHRCERFRRKQGYGIAPGKGDHAVWIVGEERISVNYHQGELDLRSLKDLARHLKEKPRDLIARILRA